MAEIAVVICDGPSCIVQRDKPDIGRNDWIVVTDWTRRRMVELTFCSWACAAEYAQAKVEARR